VSDQPAEYDLLAADDDFIATYSDPLGPIDDSDVFDEAADHVILRASQNNMSRPSSGSTFYPNSRPSSAGQRTSLLLRRRTTQNSDKPVAQLSTQITSVEAGFSPMTSTMPYSIEVPESGNGEFAHMPFYMSHDVEVQAEPFVTHRGISTIEFGISQVACQTDGVVVLRGREQTPVRIGGGYQVLKERSQSPYHSRHPSQHGHAPAVVGSPSMYGDSHVEGSYHNGVPTAAAKLERFIVGAYSISTQQPDQLVDQEQRKVDGATCGAFRVMGPRPAGADSRHEAAAAAAQRRPRRPMSAGAQRSPVQRPRVDTWLAAKPQRNMGPP